MQEHPAVIRPFTVGCVGVSALKKPQSSSISTLGICALAFFALAIVGALGGLLYKSRARNQTLAAADMQHIQIVATNPEASVDLAQAQLGPTTDPLLKIASRPGDEPVIVARADAVPQEPATEIVAENSKADAAPAEPIADGPSFKPIPPPDSKSSEMGNDLIGEINGQSYTAKKMGSNNLPATPNRPGAKKPEVKKPVVPPQPAKPSTPVAMVPSKPQPAATAQAKPAVPTLPPLPTAGEGKIDFLKAPVYVLNDGRRLRAVLSKETDGQIAIRNEAGTLITFKKSDVKEIIRN